MKDKPGGERYHQLLDTAPDAMVVVVPDGSIDFVNLQTEKLFGYARSELLGRSLEMLIPSRSRTVHGGHVGRFFSSPTARPMGSGLELFGRHKDGTEIPIEVSLSPLRTDEGMFVSAAIRDISERKKIEEELRATRIAAEAGSAAKSEFLSSMSHELRTPLNAILGFAQLMQRDRKEVLSIRQQDRIEQVLKSGEHLLHLIDDILDLSRVEAGRVSITTEPVNVVDVLRSVTSSLEPTATRAGVQLDVGRIPEEVPMIASDRTRFAQILMNYGSNAIKYNKPNGSVTFAISRRGTDTVRVSVADTGIGIAADKQDKLFQPFQRAGQETGPIEGTGIGLAISKRLAELMGGSVGFVSVLGRGSVFWVEMPVHVLGASESNLPASRRVGARYFDRDVRSLVLYIEDNPANIAFIEDLLDVFEGIELITAATAEIGLVLAHERKPRVIIMDINLPGMSGIEALGILRASSDTRSIPVIALTAAASERDRQQGEQAGFYRYLTKPVKVAELEAALDEILTLHV